MTPAEELAEWGWRKTRSRVRFPGGAWRYWQRWEDGSQWGWVEFPHDLPIEMVRDTIRDLDVPKSSVEYALRESYDPTA